MLALLHMAWVGFAIFCSSAVMAVPLDKVPDASLRVIEGLPAATTVEQVAHLPDSSMSAHRPQHNYKVSIDSPLWLHVKLPSAVSPNGQALLLELSAAIVDRFEMYQRDASGAWVMRAAGDRVAHQDWPLDSLRPRFALTQQASGNVEAFIRVVHQIPTSLHPKLLTERQAVQQDKQQILWVGLLVGVVLSLVLACAQMAQAYRDPVYVWYALYLMGVLLAALCYSGIAHAWLWPQATKFASNAVVYGVILALAFNIQFSRAMFGALQGRIYQIIGRTLFLLCIAFCLLTHITERYASTVPPFIIICALSFAYILYSGLDAWRKGERFAGYWLLIYAPFLLIIGLTLANNIGVIELAWWPEQMPVLVVIFEAIAMMLCINAYGRLRHAQTVQQQTTALHDPLTGFLNASEFSRRASRMWLSAQATGRCLIVVYISVEPREADAMDDEALMTRSVRMVRSIMRELDIVGRLSRRSLGLILVDFQDGDALQARLSRLVALGLMRDAHESRSLDIRFRMSVGNSNWSGEFTELENALKSLLSAKSQDTKLIHFLNQRYD
jgi:two-component system, sensor histidine kinase LadS